MKIFLYLSFLSFTFSRPPYYPIYRRRHNQIQTPIEPSIKTNSSNIVLERSCILNDSHYKNLLQIWISVCFLTYPFIFIDKDN